MDFGLKDDTAGMMMQKKKKKEEEEEEEAPLPLPQTPEAQ